MPEPKDEHVPTVADSSIPEPKDEQASKTVDSDDDVDDEPKQDFEILVIDPTKSFLFRIDSVFETLNQIMIILGRSRRKAREDYVQLLKQSKEQLEKLHETTGTSDGSEPDGAAQIDWADLEKRGKAFDRALEASRIVPPSLFVSMVSQFDGYLSELSRGLFGLRPEKLRSLQRSISLADVALFKSIDELKKHLLDTEIDDVLRKSHLDQLKWLGKKFDFTIDEDDSLIKAFIEVTERRNLWVHAEGQASKEYIELMNSLGLPVEVEVGELLHISRQYMEDAHATVYQIAVRLSQISWRNSREDHLEHQDDLLHDVSYDLLCEKRYALARSILDFAFTLKKTSNDVSRRMFCINRAIAFKFGGKEEEVAKILSKFDWTATAPKFKMAISVLSDRPEEAINMMRDMPKDHDSGITEESYRKWPLFLDLRSNPDFVASFEKIFGEPLRDTSLKTATEEGQRDVEAADMETPTDASQKDEAH
jgi:hypothetical protein